MPLAPTGIDIAHGRYHLSSDKARVQIAAVHRFLSEESYWSQGIPIEVVAAAIENSFCLGVYTTGPDGDAAHEEQVGFARLVTDYVTFAWLCDVYVHRDHRAQGLSKAMLRAILELDWIRTMRRKLLATRDAQRLYEQFGFATLEFPERWMQILDRNVYRRDGGQQRP